MNLLELSAVAQSYYDGLRAPSLAQGWEKYVATNGQTCMFVHATYEPQPGEAVFFLTVRNRKTSCQLYKQAPCPTT